MADEEETEGAGDDEKPAKKPKSSGGGGGIVGKLINAVGIFVLALGATIVGGTINAKLHPQQEYTLGPDGKLTVKEVKVAEKAAGHEAPKPAFYVELDPPLVVNFDDSQSVRFLQVSMQLLTREEHAGELVKLHSPIIRNNLLQVLNGRDYHELMTREGKEKLRQECLKEVQKILTKEAGAPTVEDLFFTSFVVQ